MSKKSIVINKTYVDESGELDNKTPEEKFAFLQAFGLIDKNEKFENWVYSTCEGKGDNNE